MNGTLLAIVVIVALMGLGVLIGALFAQVTLKRRSDAMVEKGHEEGWLIPVRRPGKGGK